MINKARDTKVREGETYRLDKNKEDQGEKKQKKRKVYVDDRKNRIKNS